MQLASLSSPHFFSYTIRSRRTQLPLLTDCHAYTYELFYHIQHIVGQGLSGTSPAEAQDQDDNVIASLVTIDLQALYSSMNRRTFYGAMKPLVDAGLLAKTGYHGQQYIVNPFKYNRLNAKQCKYVSSKLREAMKQLQV